MSPSVVSTTAVALMLLVWNEIELDQLDLSVTQYAIPTTRERSQRHKRTIDRDDGAPTNRQLQCEEQLNTSNRL